MATHSSVLAWRIPGMGEPGGLPSMGSHGVEHDWSDSSSSSSVKGYNSERARWKRWVQQGKGKGMKLPCSKCHSSQISMCSLTGCLLGFQFPKTEKAMATHPSTLAWKIPWTKEPGRLQSMRSLRVGHNWATSLSFHFHALEKEMATHSSVLAWRIPGTGEPGGLPSMGSHRVRHNWSDLAAAAAAARQIKIDYKSSQ